MLKNRSNVIAAIIVIIVLAAGYYINSQNKKTVPTNSSKIQTKDDNKTATQSIKLESASSSNKNIVSSSPANNASLTVAPTEVSIKFAKKIIGGSEIKVVSDKGVDVVPSANTISPDSLTLSVPVKIISKGVYSASYNVSFLDGSKTSGEVKFALK